MIKLLNGLMRYGVLGLVLVGLVVPNVAYQGLINCGKIQTDSNGKQYVPVECTINDLLGVPVGIFNWLIGLSVVVLMLVIVIAGVRMMLYYVSDSPEAELQSAKMTLRYGLFGFALVLLAYTIVNGTLAVLGFDKEGLVAKLMGQFFPSK